MLERESHRLQEQQNVGLLEQVRSLQVLVDDGRVFASKLSRHNAGLQLQLQDFVQCNASHLVQVSVHTFNVPIVFFVFICNRGCPLNAIDVLIYTNLSSMNQEVYIWSAVDTSSPWSMYTIL